MIRMKKANQLPDLAPPRAIWTRNSAFTFHSLAEPVPALSAGKGSVFLLVEARKTVPTFRDHALSPPGPARGYAESFDQRFRRLYILKLRLNFDQVPVVFVCGIGGERRFRLFQLLM